VHLAGMNAPRTRCTSRPQPSSCVPIWTGTREALTALHLRAFVFGPGLNCLHRTCRYTSDDNHDWNAQEYRCLQGVSMASTTMVMPPGHGLLDYFLMAAQLSNHTQTCPEKL